MKSLLSAALLVLATGLAHAAVLEFGLSPPGTSPGVGLSPIKGIIPGPGNGSSGEFGPGIFFDTSPEARRPQARSAP